MWDVLRYHEQKRISLTYFIVPQALIRCYVHDQLQQHYISGSEIQNLLYRRVAWPYEVDFLIHRDYTLIKEKS